MINTVRVPGNVILGKYGSAIWDVMIETVKTTKDFIICFYCSDSKELKAVTKYLSENTAKLIIRTDIKLWENCKDERVFLDVTEEKFTNHRFHIGDVSADGVIKAMSFMRHHNTFVRDAVKPTQNKRQKRNDSPEYDTNKN